MVTPLIKLGAIAFRTTIMPISFLVIASGFIGASVTAETESENSSDVFSEPIVVDGQEEKDETETQPEVSSDIPSLSVEKKPPQISDIIEVNSRSQQWENIHTGDSSRGTIKFKF